ncbi:MAG: lysophospholipid acyltransferase family protein [Planctomycetota bacterium]
MIPPSSESAPPVESTLFYRTGRLLLRGILGAMHRPLVEGREHLPRTGGVVIASNHQSFLDIPLIATSTARHVAFVARSTLRQSRLLAFVMRQSGVILVHRDRPDHSAVRAMVDYLARGGCVCVFPEGTRTRDGSLGRFRSGAVVAARKARVPIVPAGVRGCRNVFPPARRFPRFGRIGLRFGPPLDPTEPGALERLRAEISVLAGADADPPDRSASPSTGAPGAPGSSCPRSP